VASNQNCAGYGKWVHICGFGDAALDYIAELEQTDDAPILQ
jgi:hypothetical protein